MYKKKTTEWHNELKPTENELNMKICLLTLYLNHFNENYVWKDVKETFLFFLFLLWHSKVNLQTSTCIFYKSTASANINSAAFDTFLKKSTFCGTQICLFCGLQQHLHLPLPIPYNILMGPPNCYGIYWYISTATYFIVLLLLLSLTEFVVCILRLNSS